MPWLVKKPGNYAVPRKDENADEDVEQAHEEANSVWQDLKRAFATARSRLGD